MKKTVAIAVSFALMMCFCISATAQNWYCVRNKNNLQPIFGSELSYVEDYGGYFLDRNHGDDSEEKVIYLTFDAGYENGNVSKILDILNEKQVSGAFFVLSYLVMEHTELVKRMSDEGHLVCNHTSIHPDMTTKNTFEEFSEEIKKLEEVYREYTGREISKYFRPPEGRFNEKTLSYAQKLGYKTIFWSFAYEDWNNSAQMSPELAKKKVLDNVHNGAIMLFHPTSNTNAEILADVIDELKNMGYTFGTLDQLTNGCR